VLKTVQTQKPEAEIDSITRETRGDETTYTITFKGRHQPQLKLTSEGELIETPKAPVRVPK
jgi:hypothetical protein